MIDLDAIKARWQPRILWATGQAPPGTDLTSHEFERLCDALDMRDALAEVERLRAALRKVRVRTGRLAIEQDGYAHSCVEVSRIAYRALTDPPPGPPDPPTCTECDAPITLSGIRHVAGCPRRGKPQPDGGRMHG